MLSATLPLTPVSASSKMIVPPSFEFCETALIASIIRDNSPPEAIF